MFFFPLKVYTRCINNVGANDASLSLAMSLITLPLSDRGIHRPKNCTALRGDSGLGVMLEPKT
jgi:hypothetical protein